MQKRKLIYWAAAFCLAFCAAFLIFGQAGSAQRAARIQYEYAAISNAFVPYTSENQPTITAVTNICYFRADGCRTEEVSAEIAYAKYLQDFRLENSGRSKSLAYSRAKEIAFVKAVARLGADGWEMIGQPGVELDTYVLNSQNNFTITEKNKEIQPNVYFKRLRQQ